MRCSHVCIGAGAVFLLTLQGSHSKQGLTEQLQNLQQVQQDVAQTHDKLQSRVQHLENRFKARSPVQPASTVVHNGSSTPSCIGLNASLSGVVAAVVIITHKRVDYLRQCLQSVKDVHGRDPMNRQKFPLFISQDGNHRAVASLASSFAPMFSHMQHIEADNFPTRKPSEPVAYYRIASHYKFVLRQAFDCWGYPKLILLEDDMRLSVDFFPYFEAGAKLLDKDPSLYCISSWNDHGQKKFVQDSQQLERSDFFPGLGWMLTNALWQSLKKARYKGERYVSAHRTSWPAAYWDDWMRLSSVRKGRQSIRPELCRTYNFGEKGSSHGQYYRKYLQPIKLNDEDVDWPNQDLQYLEAAAYQSWLNGLVRDAKLVSSVEEIQQGQSTVKLMYAKREEYEALSDQLGMISDWKDGIPRASYHGVVSVRVAGVRCMLVPSNQERLSGDQTVQVP